MAKQKGSGDGTTIDIPGVGKMPVPKLVATDHSGVIKVAPDVASVLRVAAEMYNVSVRELLDPYIRALARAFQEQIKLRVNELDLAEKDRKD